MAFSLGGRTIGPGHPCFVVAELSGNHRQQFDEASALVKAAKEAGADAVKLQTYTPDTITLNSDKEWFRVGGEHTPVSWKGKTLYQLYAESYTPWDWHPKLKKLADELGMILFSTPFDETSVDFLEAMHVPCYKIASYEVTDFVLLRKVARTGKPVIISIGYASEAEVRFAIDTLRQNGTSELVVLHCVTGYSKRPRLQDMHLRTIKDIREKFGVVAGFSDNNVGTLIPLMAAHAGASMIEKHFILGRATGGPDARFSLEPKELAQLILSIRKGTGVNPDDFTKALGKVHYGPMNDTEEYNKRWRRSLFAGQDITKGALFTKENVRDVRPAFGLPTRYYDEVIGRRAAKDIPFATPLTWDMVE